MFKIKLHARIKVSSNMYELATFSFNQFKEVAVCVEVPQTIQWELDETDIWKLEVIKVNK